jgi:hypothetical protein
MGQTEAGEPLGDPAGVAIEDVAQQQLGTHAEHLHGALIREWGSGKG